MTTTTKITTRELDAFRNNLLPGTVLVCTHNAFRASFVGQRRTIKKTMRASLDVDLGNGGNYSMAFPTRVRDVVSLTEDAIVFETPKGVFGFKVAKWGDA